MSNMPRLRTVHGNGAFMSRPKSKWKGGRFPRSQRAQWEQTMAFRRYQEASKFVTVPELPEDPGCGDPVCTAAEGLGFQLTKWQHRLLHQMNQEDKSNA